MKKQETDQGAPNGASWACRCEQRDPEKHWTTKEHNQFHNMIDMGWSREDANFVIASARLAKGEGR